MLHVGRNPLKSGQGFNLYITNLQEKNILLKVVIPLNRVKVSTKPYCTYFIIFTDRRNPLKSGQGFN